MWSIKKVFGIYFMLWGLLIVGLAISQWMMAGPTNFSIRFIADGETFFVAQSEFNTIPHPYSFDWAISAFQFYGKLPLLIIIFAGYRLFRLGSKAYPLRNFISRSQ